jgi:hypothetical protein
MLPRAHGLEHGIYFCATATCRCAAPHASARRSRTRSLQHSTQLSYAVCMHRAKLSPLSLHRPPYAVPLVARLAPRGCHCRASQPHRLDKPHSAASASHAASHCQPLPGFLQHVRAPDAVPTACPCASARPITVLPPALAYKEGHTYHLFTPPPPVVYHR